MRPSNKRSHWLEWRPSEISLGIQQDDHPTYSDISLYRYVVIANWLTTIIIEPLISHPNRVGGGGDSRSSPSDHPVRESKPPVHPLVIVKSTRERKPTEQPLFVTYILFETFFPLSFGAWWLLRGGPKSSIDLLTHADSLNIETLSILGGSETFTCLPHGRKWSPSNVYGGWG